jgi:hypothetical protein
VSQKTLFAFTLVGALPFLGEPGIAENASPLHQGSWPIQNGYNRQPTQDGLSALHDQDVTSGEAREVDRLYDQLMSTGESKRRTRIAHSR